MKAMTELSMAEELKNVEGICRFYAHKLIINLDVGTRPRSNTEPNESQEDIKKRNFGTFIATFKLLTN